MASKPAIDLDAAFDAAPDAAAIDSAFNAAPDAAPSDNTSVAGARAVYGRNPDGSLSTRVIPRNGKAPFNHWSWMAPAFSTLGGVMPTIAGQPELAPPLAMLGGATGTLLDQTINKLLGTEFAPRNGVEAVAGEAGNAALGLGSEVAPGLIDKAVSPLRQWLGKALYKAALHETAGLRASFPDVGDIGEEAWRMGAPRINEEGQQQVGREMSERGGRALEQLRSAEGRPYPNGTGLQRVWAEGSARVPATVARDVEMPLPMEAPAQGAPMIERWVPVEGGDLPERGWDPYGRGFVTYPGQRAGEYSAKPMGRVTAPDPVPTGEPPLGFEQWQHPSNGPTESAGPHEMVFQGRRMKKVMVPSEAVPNPPVSVTARYYEPGTREIRGLAPASETVTPPRRPGEAPAPGYTKPRYAAQEPPSLEAMRSGGRRVGTSMAGERAVMDPGQTRFKRTAEMIADLRRNVPTSATGPADDEAAAAMFGRWLSRNEDVAGLEGLYDLAGKASDEARWFSSLQSGGGAQDAANSRLNATLNKNLNQDLLDYIDEELAKKGVGSIRGANAETQKAIAVNKAMQGARNVSPPRVNADNAGKQVKWGMFQDPETLGDIGRYMGDAPHPEIPPGGPIGELPPMNATARRLIRAARGAGYTLTRVPATAARFAPSVAASRQRPGDRWVPEQAMDRESSNDILARIISQAMAGR